MTENDKIKYHLKGNIESREVFLDGKCLYPGKSQKLCNHSPDGFCWGYGGSGPAQLALAVCLEIMPPEKALEVYHDFKTNVIALLPQKDFEVYFWLNGEGKVSMINFMEDFI